ncbi:MAG TPA: cyanophycinase [Planctomycetaceae bacterium]|nr:cyanophycinase [Planctomycetaceae bacterium]
MQRTLRLLRRLCSAAVLAGLVLFLPDGVDDDADGPSVRFLISLGRGTLVICGGGEISDDVLHEFIDAAGGEEARVVVVTTASETADSDEIEDELEFWRSQNLARLTVLHTRSRETANDVEFASPLADATGIWFVGGNQAWLADTYLGTVCEQMIHRVMQRGGAVGGISAGAAVMSSVMIREGKTSPEIGRGFGLLPGTVIDQHFLARNRQERLFGALAAHPGLVGLGIDERAALVVRGCRLSVVGNSDVVACISASSGRSPKIATLRPGEQANLLALSLAANKPHRHTVFRLASHESPGD